MGSYGFKALPITLLSYEENEVFILNLEFSHTEFLSALAILAQYYRLRSLQQIENATKIDLSS